MTFAEPAAGTGLLPPRADPADGYDAAVARLFDRRPERIVRGLHRIRALCRELGDPQHAYETVHLTGTNGKTSMARMVTSLLVAHGRRVGTYTSPHLQDVRERVRIDGAPIDREIFFRALTRLERRIERTEPGLGEAITFFEALTALGATSFRDAGVDTGVIEVGMGGRCDATNVHDGRVAVIGTVALDHVELGSTVAEVAGEKAGIIKDGAVVVVAPQSSDADRVIAAEARRRGALVRRVGVDLDVVSRLPRPGGQATVLRIGTRCYDVELPLRGAHQATNAVCALAAADALLEEQGGLRPDAVRAAFADVRSPGRLEVVSSTGGCPVVLDGAHNPDGARSLVAGLLEAFPGRRLVAVLGMLGGKDVDGVVSTVLEVTDRVVVTSPPSGRGGSTDGLAQIVRGQGAAVSIVPSVQEAIAAARRWAGPEGVVVVTGSLYLVGAARDALGVPIV